MCATDLGFLMIGVKFPGRSLIGLVPWREAEEVSSPRPFSQVV